MARKKKSGSNKLMKFAQSCCSRECVKNHSDETDKKIGCCPTTPHEVNFGTGKIRCLYCGKVSNLP